MAMIDEEYQNIYWPQLREALNVLFLNNPTIEGANDLSDAPMNGTGCQRISFEQMYSAVYKCVCKQYSEKLYSDLINHVDFILQKWKTNLESFSGDMAVISSCSSSNPVVSIKFVHEFHNVTSHYCQALNSVIPIFTYMNRFYVESKLQTNLKAELLKLYSERIADAFVEFVLQTLASVQSDPFSISPSLRQSLLQQLHSINPKYSLINQDLFSRHIPSGIRPAMAEEELEAQRAADRALQEQLRNQGFSKCDQSRKRSIDSSDQFSGNSTEGNISRE